MYLWQLSECIWARDTELNSTFVMVVHITHNTTWEAVENVLS